MSVINTFYLKTLEEDQPKIGHFISADISKAMLISRFVFVLYVRILPDISWESFQNFDELDEATISTQWYNNITAVGQIRQYKYKYKYK